MRARDAGQIPRGTSPRAHGSHGCREERAGGLSTTIDGTTLVAELDCSRDYPAAEYFGHDDVRVVEASLGRYREAGAVPASRFGYRFAIRNVGRPAVIGGRIVSRVAVGKRGT